MKYRFSEQSLSVFMVLLQRSLMAERDIVPDLLALEFEPDAEGQLVVTNPPTALEFPAEPEMTDEEVKAKVADLSTW